MGVVPLKDLRENGCATAGPFTLCSLGATSMNQAGEHPKHPDVVYNIQRDEDDEGTFVFAHSKTMRLGDGSPYQIAHLHVPDGNVRSNRWSAGDVQVDEDHRRRGIATHMYQIMTRELGASPSPSGVLSPDGKALWSSGKTIFKRY